MSRDFCAGGDTAVVVRELPEVENILSVEGLVFDTVTDVTEEWFEDPSAISPWDMKWLKWHAFYEEGPLNGDPYGSEKAREEAYWRTLVADSDGSGGKAPDEFGDCFRIWRYFKSNYGMKPGRITESWIPEFDFAELPEDIITIYDAFLDQIATTVRGRKLFKTQRGYIGIGSWAVKPGWSICILHGGNFPLLAQTAGFLTFESSKESEMPQRNQISEESGDTETCHIEELRLAEETRVEDGKRHQTNDLPESKGDSKMNTAEDPSLGEETKVMDGERSRTSEVREVKSCFETRKVDWRPSPEEIKAGNGEGHRLTETLEADDKERKTEDPRFVETTKVAYLSFSGTADCYVHGIMDGQALEIAEADGLKAGRVFFA